MSERKTECSNRGSGEKKALYGVYYRFPQVEDGAVLTMPEWNIRIKEFIRKIEPSDPVHAAVIGLRSLNQETQAKECVQVLLKYLETVQDPTTSKEQKLIDMESEEFTENVLPVECALDFLRAVGFVKISKDWKDYLEHFDYVYPISDFDIAINMLLNIEGFKFELDRDCRMYSLKELFRQDPYIPVDFFVTSPMGIEIERKMKESKIRSELHFRNLYRFLRSKNTPMYTRIQLILPNEKILEGTFSAEETLKDVRVFVESVIDIDKNFKFVSAELHQDRNPEEVTLRELHLVPTGRLKIKEEPKQPPPLVTYESSNMSIKKRI